MQRHGHDAVGALYDAAGKMDGKVMGEVQLTMEFERLYQPIQRKSIGEGRDRTLEQGLLSQAAPARGAVRSR